MLSAAAIKSANQAASYFAKDNYYTAEAEGPSAWWGAGATAAGFSGGVDAARFEAALRGELPDGTRLGTERNGEWQHKPGWDLTWSAPKSVSLLALVGGDTRLITAHDNAVRVAMAHIEGTQVHTRVRHGGDVALVQTDNLAAALFRHDVNRNQEPQLHTHAVVRNATRTEDGQWRSIESRPMLKAIKASGEFYRAHLAAEIRRLGYDIVPGKDGTFEIAGIGQETLDRFSSRSAQVEARLEDKGLTRATASTGQKMDAALRSRRAKEPVDRAVLTAAWRARLGEDLRALASLVRTATRHEQSYTRFAWSQQRAAREAVETAISALSEREQAFSHDRLMQAASRFALGRATPDAVERAVAHLVTAGALVPRDVTEPSPQIRADTIRPGYTTPAAIRTELKLFDLLDHAKGTARPFLSANAAQAAVRAAEERSAATGHGWNDAQRAAAAGILRSRDRTVVLQGAAGTAKTSTVLATVAAAASAAGHTVRALAPSASAAQTLGKALHLEGQTVHRFLSDLARDGASPGLLDRLADGREVWIVDEMSLLGTGKTVELLQAAKEQRARVILTGDRLQLGSVEAGQAFTQAQERGLETFRLDEIVRQQTAEGRAAVKAIITRDAATAFQALERDSGRIVEEATANDRIMMMARHYAGLSPAERANTLLIDPSREGSEAIKGTVRTLLRMQGELAGPTAHGTRLLDAGLGNAEKQSAVSYTVGQVIRTAKGLDTEDGRLGPGEYAVISAIDTRQDRLTLRTGDGQARTLATRGIDPRHLDVFQPAQGDLQLGDRIRWNRNDTRLGLARGDFGTVTAIDGNQATIGFEKGRELRLDVTEPRHQHYDYAYAVTAYSAQGMTKDWVLHAESWRVNLINWRSMYVGISRGTTSGTIITDDRALLEEAIGVRAGEKSLAIDPSLITRVRDATQEAVSNATRSQIVVEAEQPHEDEALHQRAARAIMARIKGHQSTVSPETSKSNGHELNINPE
ncbi:Relaxase domain-containing protein (plasmid) [Rhodovastum atsumiense]|uniref:Relaxase domain-containing protein n=1 Tax=Rhodovastum atsumiense TaxID=504468 RepID=A0A5M6IM49_9PROT|nr:MobF family relaxase [Rhodovastum atsumiense]KAA5608638.1 relaxase domain-containing protein [Rhodovastum atsumiense]CAH2605967.1 Relaxase domain-containing protein [Rhodovastum atsumiense]